ncbi:hypothetical protein VHEMI06810 [[Torrubiella] hemipterigena]|uniref:RNA helicase HEL117 n=1 Tax=[Torrubiella] hemipterigena TaxID=1531966 RepID=A0A0A1TLS5_9HYPO|nr:hypothetical protein VHEMI06810 [[Torrubiella] hemipterigena]
MSDSRHQRSSGRDDRSRHGDRSHRHRDRRSRSPATKEHRSHRSRHSSKRDRSPRKKNHDNVAIVLPYNARQLSKYDLPQFERYFAYYLDIQKQRYIEDMDDIEVKGRWKSFMRKWNNGELAEGWYDPESFAKHKVSDDDIEPTESTPNKAPIQDQNRSRDSGIDGSDSEDENYGPTLPGGRRAGASIPSLQDLAERDEMRRESREAERETLRDERKADRKLQKERLEELVPRAEAGTRERKLEKRKEVNDKMREFRDKSPGMEAGNEKDLMGGGDSLEEYKRAKAQEKQRKSEREVMREEIARAKQEELEERRRRYQEKEQGTISMLQELARQRFG